MMCDVRCLDRFEPEDEAQDEFKEESMVEEVDQLEIGSSPQNGAKFPRA